MYNVFQCPDPISKRYKARSVRGMIAKALESAALVGYCWILAAYRLK